MYFRLADNTTHRDDYRELPLEKRFVRERDSYRQPEGSMETLTTHRETYTQKSSQRPAAVRPQEQKRV